MSQGIAADKIQVRAEGKEQELSKNSVLKLQMQDAQKPEQWTLHRPKVTWLAYNRRVDIILEPTGQQSMKEFPNDAPEHAQESLAAVPAEFPEGRTSRKLSETQPERYMLGQEEIEGQPWGSTQMRTR